MGGWKLGREPCAVKILHRRWEKNWPELHAAVRGGFPDFVFARDPAEPVGVPTFWYHDVSPDSIEADLRFLRENGYSTATADDLLGHIEGRRACPPRSVVLCFDDGSVNLRSVVFPALRSFDARAVAFISPHFHTRIGGADRRRPCTWDEIRDMHRSGLVDFQSHTLEHRYVPRWPEPVGLAGVDSGHQGRRSVPLPMTEDFRIAREIIERELDKEVLHLAFPRHDGTAAAVQAGVETGYRLFWWGAQPVPPEEIAGGLGLHASRVSGEFLRRMPGRGRLSLFTILRRRYLLALRSLTRGRPAVQEGEDA
ncbi:MAG: hypothetical protein EA350_03875 [Gemmatimonadales bacterium]|nr:MAG: hypothetical protein EA350_03875 [Gemmatimonadales bacterium]